VVEILGINDRKSRKDSLDVASIWAGAQAKEESSALAVCKLKETERICGLVAPPCRKNVAVWIVIVKSAESKVAQQFESPGVLRDRQEIATSARTYRRDASRISLIQQSRNDQSADCLTTVKSAPTLRGDPFRALGSSLDPEQQKNLMFRQLLNRHTPDLFRT